MIAEIARYRRHRFTCFSEALLVRARVDVRPMSEMARDPGALFLFHILPMDRDDRFAIFKIG
jgi:hypothetical protein